MGKLTEWLRTLDVPITAIGRMESPAIGEKAQITVLDKSGQILTFDCGGWTHF
jgi:hypothetical protein